MLLNFVFMTETSADRLFRWLDEQRVSPSEFARKLGTTPQVLNNWKTRGRVPGDRLFDVAKAMGRSAKWLKDGEDEVRIITSHPLTVVKQDEPRGEYLLEGPEIRGSVPLISWARAGDFVSVVDNYQPGDAEEWIETDVPIRRHTFALRVQGDSMEPEFRDGTNIIVEPEMAYEPGDFVVVRANGDTECTFKQLVKDGNDWFLKPINPRYPVKPLPHDAVIVGVVRGQTKRYK
jgi:SOS-response transcriptional repressor LexA